MLVQFRNVDISANFRLLLKYNIADKAEWHYGTL